MPKIKIRNLTLRQITRISGTRWALKEVNFAQAVKDALTGTDEVTIKAEQITAHFSNVGLSFVVGNTTTSIVADGATTFFNVGGTNSIGSDGADTFLIDGATVKKYAGG